MQKRIGGCRKCERGSPYRILVSAIFPSILLTRRANGMVGVEQIYNHCYQEVNVALNVGVCGSLTGDGIR
jgi:hypothetical protein